MTVLTPAQVATYCGRAGFTGTRLTRAVAVALAESGGKTDAVGVNHDSHRSRDRGLFQINSYWHKEVTDAQAFNPETAAAAAFRISKGGADWHEWSTWNNGKAQLQMSRAALAVGQAKQANPGVQPAGWHLPHIPVMPINPLDPLNKFNDPLDPLSGNLTPGQVIGGAKDAAGAVKAGAVMAAHAAAWMADPHNWLRVVMVSGGTAGVLAGLYLLAKSGAAGSTAARAAGTTSKTIKSAATLAALA